MSRSASGLSASTVSGLSVANAAAVARAESAEHGSFNELHALAARSKQAAASIAEAGTRTLNADVVAAQNRLRSLRAQRNPGESAGRSADSARFLPEEYDDDPVRATPALAGGARSLRASEGLPDNDEDTGWLLR